MADIKGLGFIQKRYTGLEEIGQGGMGVVYKATDTTLDRDVAIKVILPHFSSRPDFKESFEREAKALANLEHPNIIPIYDYNSVKKGSYYVMALMTGKTLQEKLSEGPMNAESFLNTARSLLAALGHAHANNILHRDIKSPNIFINEEGHTFLGDFGVALPASEHSSMASQQFHFQGTPAYASPEQIEGHRLTPASDIYSLGILFYEMLSGSVPFSGSLNSVLTGQLTRKPPRLEITEPRLQHMTALVARMLDKVPGNRPHSCDEVRNLLDHPELVSPLAPEEMEEESNAEGTQAAALTSDQLALQLAERIKLYRSRYNDAARLLKQLEGSKGRIDKQMFRELKGKYSASLEENMGALEELFHQAETCITELELMLKHDQDRLKELEGKKTELRFLREGKAINDEELAERSAPIDTDMDEVRDRIEARSERLNRLIGSLEKHHVTRVIPTAEKILTWSAWTAAGIAGALILYLLFLSFSTVPGRVGGRTISLFKKPTVNSSPAGKGWKNELVSILSVKRSNRDEVTSIRKTFLQSGLKLIEIKRGTILRITGKTKNTFTVNYNIPNRGMIRGATVSRSSVRRNSWYKIKTAGGAKGWVLAQGVHAWKKSSVFKRFVFNIQRLFGKSRRQSAASGDTGQTITGTLPGKKGWVITGDPKKGRQQIRFNFHLDNQGAAAVSSSLTKEIAYARLTGLQSRANTLEELKAAFTENDYAHAQKMIIGISLVGPFNAWNSTLNPMKKGSMGIYTVYSTDELLSCIRTNEAYGYILTLASSDRKVKVFVPDPLSSVDGKAARLKLDPKKNRFPKLRLHTPASVTASSEDPDNPVLSLIDDRTNSSWHSAPGKSGLDTRMEFKFPVKRRIRQIGIKNGSGYGSAVFAYNRAARIQFAAGKAKLRLFLRDGDAGEQRFTLPKPVLTDRVILVIEEIYPGNRSKQAAITDVYFYY